MSKIKVIVDKAIRQEIMNAYIQEQIGDKDIHKIIKINNIQLYN